MKVKRRLQLAAAFAAVALSATLAAAPAAAQPTAKFANNPTVACRLNGVDTGTLQGWRYSTYATSSEPSWGGECGTVRVRVLYYVPGGSGGYASSWVYDASYAHSGGFPAVSQGYHNATRAAYQITSFP